MHLPKTHLRASLLPVVPLLMIGLGSDAFAQGSICSTPTLIGPGSQVNRTVYGLNSHFYEVSVPAGMEMEVTETRDTYDTIYWLHTVGCTANLVINIDAGLNHFTWLNASSATVPVIIEVRSFDDSHPHMSTYDFDLAINDLCMPDAFEDNDDCATATAMVDGTYPALAVSNPDSDHYEFFVRDGGIVTFEVSHKVGFGDIDAFLRLAGSPECGSGLNGGLDLLASGMTNTSDEIVIWTNSTGADVDVVLELNMDREPLLTCNIYDLAVTGTGEQMIGPVFCSPMDPNSTGASTQLSGSWGSATGSDLHLEATSGPPNQFGLFLVGLGIWDPGVPVSNGRLCFDLSVGLALGRYNLSGPMNSIGMFDTSGTFQNLAGNSTVGTGFDVPSTVPIPGVAPIVLGTTLHFQLWHRENGGASNFSNGLTVTF